MPKSGLARSKKKIVALVYPVELVQLWVINTWNILDLGTVSINDLSDSHTGLANEEFFVVTMLDKEDVAYLWIRDGSVKSSACGNAAGKTYINLRGLSGPCNGKVFESNQYSMTEIIRYLKDGQVI